MVSKIIMRSIIHSALICSFCFAGMLSAKESFVLNSVWYKPPAGSFHLDPAIFLPTSSFSEIIALGLKEGDPVKLTRGSKTLIVRSYKIKKTGAIFGMGRSLSKKLGLKRGYNKLKFSKIGPHEESIPSRPLHPHFESYPAASDQWNGYAFGAPHGDCDWFTGDIVKMVTDKFEIPSTAAYGCRFPYAGVWYDCNRPLMKPPTGSGVSSERKWSSDASNYYQDYQSLVFESSSLNRGERFKLFTSFHGHDLTVKISNRTYSRNVIESIATGFSKEMIREMKSFMVERLKFYFEKPPLILFGNLPEDLTYYYRGVRNKFVYSATGTRMYGSLRSDLTEYGLHFETPNSMRVKPEDREKTAELLNDLYSYLKEVLPTKRKQDEDSFKIQIDNKVSVFVPVRSGTFSMGAPRGVGWDSERPQHKVYLSSYSINKYEVTNDEYVQFLNDALFYDMIEVQNGIVRSKMTGKIWLKTRSSSSLAQITFRRAKFKVTANLGQYPVFYVSYFGAKAYSDYYGEKLPTEAQWEKAASWNPEKNRKNRYGVNQKSVRPNLANFEDSDDGHDHYRVGTTPVGHFNSTSYYGAKDMSGNVWEWCEDYYGDRSYVHRKSRSVTDPQGLSKTTMKVVRGGAWNSEFFSTRSTIRLGISPEATLVNVGFRTIKAH